MIETIFLSYYEWDLLERLVAQTVSAARKPWPRVELDRRRAFIHPKEAIAARGPLQNGLLIPSLLVEQKVQHRVIG